MSAGVGRQSQHLGVTVSNFSAALTRRMAEQEIGVRELARAVFCHPGHISKLRSGQAKPSPELAAAIDHHLGADGALAALLPVQGMVALPDDDVISAIELERRALHSDVSDRTVERLELAVDDLAVAYPRTPPGDLLSHVRQHLEYTAGLLAGKTTLAQHRRLLVSGGWFALLAATVLIDLHEDSAGVAYLRTAQQMARETEHAEIAAWVLETRAWMALTGGDYMTAVELSRSAQDAAPQDGSALIQATAQEGRAWARLGDAPATREALTRVERLVSPLPVPSQPEHHYRYDPQKADVYVATTLSWIGDSAAEPAARSVLADLAAGIPPRPRRVALARLDLGKALANAGKDDEAAGAALAAIESGRLAPVDAPRVREIVAAVAERGVPEGHELAEAWRALDSGG